MPKLSKDPLANFRRLIGIASVNWARYDAGLGLDGLVFVSWNEYPAKESQGTRARCTWSKLAKLRKKKPQNAVKPRLPLTRSVVEAVELLAVACAGSTERAMDRSKEMMAALAAQIDETHLLPEFSPMVIAAACMTVTSDALEEQPFLFEGRHNLNEDAIRTAYIHLWLHRRQLTEVIRENGGNVERLPTPKTRKKKDLSELMLRDKGITVPFQQRLSTDEKFKARLQRRTSARSRLQEI